MMSTKTVRSVWGWDPRWIRVEHLDEEGYSLGYTEFEPASSSTDSEVLEALPEATDIRKNGRIQLRDLYRWLQQWMRTLGKRLPIGRFDWLANHLGR